MSSQPYVGAASNIYFPVAGQTFAAGTGFVTWLPAAVVGGENNIGDPNSVFSLPAAPAGGDTAVCTLDGLYSLEAVIVLTSDVATNGILDISFSVTKGFTRGAAAGAAVESHGVTQVNIVGDANNNVFAFTPACIVPLYKGEAIQVGIRNITPAVGVPTFTLTGGTVLYAHLITAF